MGGKLVWVNRYNLCEEIASFLLSVQKEDTSIFISQETANLLKENGVSLEESQGSHKHCEFGFTCKTKKHVGILTRLSHLKYFACTAYRITSCGIVFNNNKKKYIDFGDSKNETVIVVSEK